MRPEDLIEALVADAKPVRRLPSPMVRLSVWLALSGTYAALVVLAVGVRPDVAARLADMRFVVELGATFITSVLAAAAAFCATCPGRPVWERFAPLPALGVWLWSLGEGCWQSFMLSGGQALALYLDQVCLPSIVLISVVPGVLILIMIQQGAPIAPVSTGALATLAASALAATALRLFHAQDASVMVLVWQFGSVGMLAGLGALTGRRILRWPEPQIATQLAHDPESRNR